MPHAISGGQVGMLPPVGAKAFHPPLALSHDALKAIPCHLASLTVPLGEMEEDRDRGGEDGGLELGLVNLGDRARGFRHGIVTRAEPPRCLFVTSGASKPRMLSSSHKATRQCACHLALNFAAQRKLRRVQQLRARVDFER
jgi:hypothetical protein